MPKRWPSATVHHEQEDFPAGMEICVTWQPLRGDRLLAARKAAGMSRRDLAAALAVPSPARIRLWESGLERPQPRFVPRLAATLGVDPLGLLDVDSEDPPLAALRLAAGLAANEMQAPGVSVMTYMRLENGRTATDPPETVVSAVARLLDTDVTRVKAAIRRSRRDRTGSTSLSG